MDLRARLVFSVLVGASIGLGTYGCKHNTIESGTQGLAVTFSPSPVTTRYTSGTFPIERLEVLPADPAAVSVYGAGQVLLLRFDAFLGQLFPAQQTAFAEVALAQGTYKIVNLTLRHPVLTQATTPIPPFGQCIDGIQFLSLSNVSPSPGLGNTLFTEADGITFTVRPGQTSLALALKTEEFIRDYQASFTCTPCAFNPAQSCLTAFNENAFRAAIIADLRIQ